MMMDGSSQNAKKTFSTVFVCRVRAQQLGKEKRVGNSGRNALFLSFFFVVALFKYRKKEEDGLTLLLARRGSSRKRRDIV